MSQDFDNSENNCLPDIFRNYIEIENSKTNLLQIKKVLQQTTQLLNQFEKDLDQHLENIPEDCFEKNESLSLEENTKNAETFYEQFEYSMKERINLINQSKKLLALFSEFPYYMNEIVEELDEYYVSDINNDIINELIKVNEVQDKNEIDEWNKRKEFIDEPFTTTIIDENQQKQIENWLNEDTESESELIHQYKYKRVLFDSDIDDYSIDKSVFNAKILNRFSLLFIIETENNDKFGSFINFCDDYDGIDHIGRNKINKNSFVFTFKDNKPMKFPIKDDFSSFGIYPQSYDELFKIGCDISIGKKEKTSEISQYF